ncbi:MAG TPA: PAS domain-containing protein, partial [Gammaproteobacteria bacterium]|nr:PAS domain-containing protein [Gammaproteobacteria bacterium]
TLAATKSDLQNRVFHSNVEIELTKSELEREMNNRARAEQALVESESRFKVLYDNTPSMSFIVEEEGEILSVNRYGAFVLGYKRDDLVGNSIFNTYHPDDKETLQAHLRDVMQNQSTLHHWEIRRISSKGETIWTWETAKAITDMLGNLSILIVSAEIDKQDTG